MIHTPKMTVVIDPTTRDFQESWDMAERQHHELKVQWIASLRASGVKAAHPRDGWVDEEARSVCFMNPYFDDGVHVGSLIVLGRPWERESQTVRVTGRTISIFGQRRWIFDAVHPAELVGGV